MASTVEIQLPCGPIIAQTTKTDFVRAFGIRYGQAQRFEPPTAVAPWTAPVDCTKLGPICPQLPFRLENVLGPVNASKRVQLEDCLTVSVDAPAYALKDAQNGKSTLPVMLWYHGGAYISGASDLDLFDTAALASRDVVVVRVGYRLGVFGYLPIPDVAPANLGLLDQIQSLKWVQENIAAFGGDKNNVTLFGQSAGGDSVYCLMIADGTKGLFHRAILTSAPFGLRWDRQPMTDAVAAKAKALIGNRNPTAMDTQDLLQIQAEVLQFGKKFKNGGLVLAPCFGVHPLPNEIDAKTRLKSVAATIPTLIGWTTDEALPYLPVAVKSIPLINLALSRYATGKVWVWGSKEIHKELLAAGGKSSTICFDWYPAGSPLRACHCIDMPFYLGEWEVWRQTPLVRGKESEKAIEVMGAGVKDLFTDFAKGVEVPKDHMIVRQGFSSDLWRARS